jgi:hypothetical protein
MNGFCGIVHKDSDNKLVHIPLEQSVISVSIVDGTPPYTSKSHFQL